MLLEKKNAVFMRLTAFHKRLYVDITYEDLKSKVTDKEDCFICGSPEMSLMPY